MEHHKDVNCQEHEKWGFLSAKLKYDYGSKIICLTNLLHSKYGMLIILMCKIAHWLEKGFLVYTIGYHSISSALFISVFASIFSLPPSFHPWRGIPYFGLNAVRVFPNLDSLLWKPSKHLHCPCTRSNLFCLSEIQADICSLILIFGHSFKC